VVLGLRKHISQCGEMVLIYTDNVGISVSIKAAFSLSLKPHSNQLSFFVKLKNHPESIGINLQNRGCSKQCILL